MNFRKVIDFIRTDSLSEKEKGTQFERLVKRWFVTDPVYRAKVGKIWLWEDFPCADQLGGRDLGIDLVIQTDLGDYWAVQCKFHGRETHVNKSHIDSFIANSARRFRDRETGDDVGFASRIWVSCNEIFGDNAIEATGNLEIPFTRIGLETLERSAVDWDAIFEEKPQKLEPKTPMPHQQDALERAREHFSQNERGQLVMACGTGKTYTSLLIAEDLLQNANGKTQGTVLFLVPSIALLNQSLNAWMADAATTIRAVCICSDAKANRKKGNADDNPENALNLALPASTNAKVIAANYLREAGKLSDEGLLVVFSTYQSIDRVRESQTMISQITGREHSFDLVICDEAHRTTGVLLKGEEQAVFTKIHDGNFIRAKKRLYMTATPRLYGEAAKGRAKEADCELCSMDDASIYGEEFHRVSFGYAVSNGLLTDYKVLVLTVGSEWQLPPELRQKVESGEIKELNFNHVSKLMGCINGLAKNTTQQENILVWDTDPRIMRRAIAFCPNIDKKGDANSSKNTAVQLPYVSDNLNAEGKNGGMHAITVRAEHVDGGMDCDSRAKKLWWLADEDAPTDECRVLCNVRCLSEGVDVPALDAAIFLAPKNSQVDVVQSVGRVMRNFRKGSPDAKRFGYIIIPVVANPKVPADEVMADNRLFAPVWTVLRALRAHDERFNAEINSIALNKKQPRERIVVDPSPFFEPDDDDQMTGDAEDRLEQAERTRQLRLELGKEKNMLSELSDKIYAKMVEKVGSRFYWERWAADIAPVVANIIGRIDEIVSARGEAREVFLRFVEELRQSINNSITEQQAIEMLGQHMITRPVFEALFSDYAFIRNNGVTKAMQAMTALLDRHGLEQDTLILQKFYESVRLNLGNIDTLSGKQTVIKNLYNSFFRGAFPKAVEQLGIVYTPVECVDFILHSVDAVLQREFNSGLTDRGVHILDPFTGTGTFITRLLQSGLIKREDMARKYRDEIHCNELVLLAYYVADVNIESVYNSLMRTEQYAPFNNISLTDTFEMGEREVEAGQLSLMQRNIESIEQQKKLPIRVIIGNPPYSAGQKSGNDNARNLKYPHLDKRIEETYVAGVDVTNKNSLYDSYIRAFRWASDRIPEEGGVIGFVSNSKWLDGNASSGMRKCLAREFSQIYVFDLKGAVRGKSGELARKAGGNVFNIMTGVCLVILVRKPGHEGKGKIHYCDIGDYLSQKEKLEIIRKRKSIFSPEMLWTEIEPDQHGDWLRQRSGLFESFVILGDKKDKNCRQTFFMPVYSRGIATGRDAWCWNFDKNLLENNMARAVKFYNEQCEVVKTGRELDRNPHNFSWTWGTEYSLQKGKILRLEDGDFRIGQYRPFVKSNLYFSRQLNERVYQIPQLFPTADAENLVICLESPGGRKEFSCYMTNLVPDLHVMEAAQCFPLYYYEQKPNQQGNLLGGETQYTRQNGISDWMLGEMRKRYGGYREITRRQIFYYVYGLLHSPDYRARFNDDLKKSLPRLPIVESYEDFAAFAKAGEELAALHLGYESVPRCGMVNIDGESKGNFLVEKMRFGGRQGQWDKSVIHYNSDICVRNIPKRAYEYVINGRSAIEWIMESYRVKVDKDSCIKNDPNKWAQEHGKPRYILNLLLSVIELSLRTLDIVAGLPRLEGKDEDADPV